MIEDTPTEEMLNHRVLPDRLQQEDYWEVQQTYLP